MKLHELKRMIDSLPPERLGEEVFMFNPFYRRMFKIEAIDELSSIQQGAANTIILITSESPNG